MTTLYKAVVQLAANSALPRDVSENTFFFDSASDATTTQLDALTIDLAGFYNATPSTGTNAIKSYLCRDRDYGSNACKVSYYKMPGTAGPTGPPVYVKSWTLSDPGASRVNLPDQVAVVLSFHSDLSTAVHPARRRGRIFLGPLNNLALEETAGAVAPQTVASVLMTDLGAAAHDLKSDTVTDAGMRWVCFSRVDWDFHDVVGGFVDDRFDTQRRRLERADSRITWS